MKINGHLSIRKLRAKRNRNHIRVILAPEGDPYRVAAVQYVKNFIQALHFPILASHSVHLQVPFHYDGPIVLSVCVGMQSG